jgi:5,5'-dehydrodivanillate O-demethylase oxygenase subunit
MSDARKLEPTAQRRLDVAATGPGTLAGTYLRRFWQPVYHSVDLVPGRPVPLTIMGELFALYRTDSGTPVLVDGRCPHRGMQLSAGWVEGEALRCFYHGWKFAADGQCLEQPAEESRFCQATPVRAYPVRDYLGLIFAWFGPGTPPDFPLYPEFERFTGLLEIDSYSRDCNYFQNLENALDMSHVGFTHGDNRAAFDGIGLGRSLRAEETDWGVAYTFTRTDGQLRVQQFGMPNIFYMNALPTDPDIGWQESLFWWVPIDDKRHMQFSLHRVPADAERAERIHHRRQLRREQIDQPHQDICLQILNGEMHIRDVDKSRVDLVRLQDDIAQVGQGRSVDREPEHLGRADIGIATIRNLWRRELEAVSAGRPGKSWKRTETIRVRAWTLQGDAPRSETTAAETPNLVDVRPYVEIRTQLAALHGSAAQR